MENTIIYGLKLKKFGVKLIVNINFFLLINKGKEESPQFKWIRKIK